MEDNMELFDEALKANPIGVLEGRFRSMFARTILLDENHFKEAFPCEILFEKDGKLIGRYDLAYEENQSSKGTALFVTYSTSAIQGVKQEVKANVEIEIVLTWGPGINVGRFMAYIVKPKQAGYSM
jgi:hypothetical protein